MNNFIRQRRISQTRDPLEAASSFSIEVASKSNSKESSVTELAFFSVKNSQQTLVSSGSSNTQYSSPTGMLTPKNSQTTTPMSPDIMYPNNSGQRTPYNTGKISPDNDTLENSTPIKPPNNSLRMSPEIPIIRSENNSLIKPPKESGERSAKAVKKSFVSYFSSETFKTASSGSFPGRNPSGKDRAPSKKTKKVSCADSRQKDGASSDNAINSAVVSSVPQSQSVTVPSSGEKQHKSKHQGMFATSARIHSFRLFLN